MSSRELANVSDTLWEDFAPNNKRSYHTFEEDEKSTTPSNTWDLGGEDTRRETEEKGGTVRRRKEERRGGRGGKWRQIGGFRKMKER